MLFNMLKYFKIIYHEPYWDTQELTEVSILKSLFEIFGPSWWAPIYTSIQQSKQIKTYYWENED